MGCHASWVERKCKVQQRTLMSIEYALPPKPKYHFELTSGNQSLAKGPPAQVADQAVHMLAAEARRELRVQQNRISQLPPPVPGRPFPTPEEYQVVTDDLLPGMRVWELVFGPNDEVIKTKVVEREEVIREADADYGPTERLLRQWNTDTVLEQLEGLVQKTAQRVARRGGFVASMQRSASGNLDDPQLDAVFSKQKGGGRSSRNDRLRPLELGR